MKKTLIAVLALAAVVACNKTEVVEQSAGNAIAFDNAFIDNATKSVVDPSFTNDNLFDDFAVYGFVEGASLFDGTQVSGSGVGESANWTYEGTQYWIAGANYNFAAVAPKTNGGWTKDVVSANTTDYTMSTTIDFTNADGTTDLLYADSGKKTGAVSGNTAVEFNFRHVLSKVKFSFENAYNASTATIKVKNIKVTNPFKTGKVLLTAGTPFWSNQQFATDFSLNFGMATDDESTTEVKENVEVAYAFGKTYESQKELLIIPGVGTETGYNVTFVVELLVSNTLVTTYNHSVTIAQSVFNPAPGCCYDIKATINASNIDPENAQEPIEFTVATLPDWTEGTNPDTIQ